MGETQTRKHKLSLMDTLDDRREVWHLLHRLPPALRVQWLLWCCKQINGRYGPVRPKMRNKPGQQACNLPYDVLIARAGKGDRDDEVLTNEVYANWWHLAAQYDLDQGATARRLEEVVRRRGN